MKIRMREHSEGITRRIVEEHVGEQPNHFAIHCRNCRRETDVVMKPHGINDYKPGHIEFYCLDCGRSEAFNQA